MTYTAKTVKEFRTEKGSLAKKITTELGLIDTEINVNVKVAKGSLIADVSGNMAFAWQNPESVEILIHTVIIDVITAGGTANSVIDVDVVANATATGNTILDGVDLNSAAISISTNVSDSGTNGNEKAHKADENGGTNDYITGKILVANASSLIGKYYIYYTTVVW